MVQKTSKMAASQTKWPPSIYKKNAKIANLGHFFNILMKKKETYMLDLECFCSYNLILLISRSYLGVPTYRNCPKKHQTGLKRPEKDPKAPEMDRKGP